MEDTASLMVPQRAMPGFHHEQSTSPVASVASILGPTGHLLVRQNEGKDKKRPRPWELSDSESDGARERKKRRVGEKQVRYAYVAHKFPKHAEATRAEDAIAWYESATDGREPLRRKQEWHAKQIRPSPLALTDLEYVKELGAGGYGRVGVVRVRKMQHAHSLDVNNAELAIKAIFKRKLREEEPLHQSTFQDRSWDEKNFERGNLHWLAWHPFIAGMYDCLADSRNLYLLQELAPLGTLEAYIEKHAPLHASVAQFYFSNIVVALEHLASLHFVHGDLKPGNILIGGNGYLMLADFGLASRWDEPRDWEHVGTPNYLSPEIVRGTIDSVAKQCLDWWGAACILYEMATGKMTFDEPDPGEFLDQEAIRDDVKERVLAAHYYWPDPDAVDPAMKWFVDEMLMWRYELRLGTVCKRLETGKVVNSDIRCHVWFDGYPWEDIENRTYAAPYVPLEPPTSTRLWHDRPMPLQYEMPGVPLLLPPRHLHFDTRRRRWVRLHSDKRNAVDARAEQQAEMARDVENNREELEAKLREKAGAARGVTEGTARIKTAAKEKGTEDDSAPDQSITRAVRSRAQDVTVAEASSARQPTERPTDSNDIHSDRERGNGGRIERAVKRDENELETVPPHSIPPALKGGTLPLFRPPTVKPKIDGSAARQSPSLFSPEETQQVETFGTVAVTTEDLLKIRVAEGWSLHELAKNIVKWKHAAESRPLPPTKAEVLWEETRLRVAETRLKERRRNTMHSLKEVASSSTSLQPLEAQKPHAKSVQRDTAQASDVDTIKLQTVLDEALGYARANGLTLRQCAERFAKIEGQPVEELVRRVVLFEDLLRQRMAKHEREAANEQPVAGPSNAVRVQARPPAQPQAAGISTDPRKRTNLAAQPIAGTSTAAPPPAIRRTASPSTIMRQRTIPTLRFMAGPSDVAHTQAPPALHPTASRPESITRPRMAPETKLGGIPPGPRMKVTGTRQPAPTGFSSSSTPGSAMNGSQTVPQQQAVGYQPYPAAATRPRRDKSRQVQGTGALPTERWPPRVHGPNRHEVSQAAGRQNVASSKGVAQHVQRPQSAQQGKARAEVAQQNVLNADLGAMAGTAVQPSFLRLLPRTPPAQTLKRGSRLKMGSTSDAEPAGQGTSSGGPIRANEDSVLPVDKQEATPGEARLECIWLRRSPEPTSTRGRHSLRASGADAGDQGSRMRSSTPTGTTPPQPSAALADNSTISGERRVSFGDDCSLLSPCIPPSMQSTGSPKSTPTRPKTPRASRMPIGASTFPLIWSPPLSPTGAVASSPPGFKSPTDTIVGPPPKWSP